MNQLAVFPSSAVARWIDADWRERARDAARRDWPNASRYADSVFLRTDPRLRAAHLRYRPFERLLQSLRARPSR